MSYDMGIGEESFNYTYNVSDMWYTHYPEEGIRKHYGMTGAESVPFLLSLFTHMVNNKERLEAMNPENGWGSYLGATEFVSELILAALRNPDEVWEGD